MEVRRIRENDLDQLLALYSHLHTEPAAPSEQLRQVWQNVWDNKDLFVYFVIEKDGLLVSSCNLSIIPNLTREARSIGLIENVVTHSDYRKQGLGNKVIAQAISHAREKGCYKVMLLSAAQRTEAHHLYEQLGFDSTEKKGFIIHL